MPRPTNAAIQMVREIGTVIPDAEFRHDEPDGLNRFRSLHLDPSTSKTIKPVLREVQDDRVASIVTEGSGKNRHLVIRFVPDPRADHAQRYGIDSAYWVLHEDDTPTDQPTDHDEAEATTEQESVSD